jgi:hypothetical protein
MCKESPFVHNFLQGRTSLLQQLQFLESLLDMVETVLSRESVSQLEASCRFADTICCSEKLSSVFACSVNLLPPDIAGTKDTRERSMESGLPASQLS